MRIFVIFTCIAVSVFCLSKVTLAATNQTAQGWPRMYESNGNKVVVHQPQLDKWADYAVLKGKSAVVVELKGEQKEYYGALDLQADTKVDFDSRTVLLDNFQVTDQTFPNLDNQLSSKCKKAVTGALPVNKAITISLDRVLANLEASKKITKGVDVNFDPPQIYYSEQPSILLIFIGEPKFEEVEKSNSKLLYAVNTNWDILQEVGSEYYFLLNGESWLVTDNLLKGEWKAAGQLPKSFNSLPVNEDWKAVQKNIPGKESKTVPKVFISTEPAELIVTDGTPSYRLINETKILYVLNSDSDLFLYSGNGQYYFLTAGRWFTSEALNGPWLPASFDLPEDFRNIPVNHEKSHVLSSVPGTPEAEAAVLLASVPRKATVDRHDTTVKVVYEGKPEFVIIKETSSALYYAVNSPYDVFKVENRYYCVYNGVWFESSSAKGPWVVCTVVPQVIYTIPSTHPKYNVTYVYIYDVTPDTIIVGYTSGYSGTYVVTTGVVVYGVGYWYYDPYYPYHRYYHYHYHPYYYSYGCAYRYDYYYGDYYRSAHYYGPYGGVGGVSGYDPATGRYYRGGYAYGPYGSAYAKQAYNPYTDRHGAQVGATTPYGSWGRSVVSDGSDWVRAGHRSNLNKTVAGIETSKGGKAIAGYNKKTGEGVVLGKGKYGDLYAGRDGNVYKKGEDGWQKKSGDSWENIDTEKARGSAQSRVDSAKSKLSSDSQKRLDTAKSKSSSESRKRHDFSRLNADKISRYSLSSKKSRGRSTGNLNRSSQSRTKSLNQSFQRRQTGNRRARSFQQRSFGGGRSRPSRPAGGFRGGRRR